jgi:hypothetical protein
MKDLLMVPGYWKTGGKIQQISEAAPVLLVNSAPGRNNFFLVKSLPLILISHPGFLLFYSVFFASRRPTPTFAADFWRVFLLSQNPFN